LQDTPFHNISGYHFVELADLALLRDSLHRALLETGVLGTILLAEEGINVALVGEAEAIAGARRWFARDARFASMEFKLSLSSFSPFSKLKVRVRPEIITFGQNSIDPAAEPAARISAAELKRWLDEGRDFCLLDARNTYEIESGTFTRAVSLEIENFRDLPDAVEQAVANGTLDQNKPLVTFCTGGVRCEKSGIVLFSMTGWRSPRRWKRPARLFAGAATKRSVAATSYRQTISRIVTARPAKTTRRPCGPDKTNRSQAEAASGYSEGPAG